MELELIITKYGKWLGGIDVERIAKLIRDRGSEAVERILGVETESEDIQALECRKARSLLEYYETELVRLRHLYVELSSSGISPSDLAPLRVKMREVRRLKNFYKEVLKRCVQP